MNVGSLFKGIGRRLGRNIAKVSQQRQTLEKVGEEVHNGGSLTTPVAAVSPVTSDDEWDGPRRCCNMTKCCKCGLEADERESNDNYRRRYIRCPRRVSVQRC